MPAYLAAHVALVSFSGSGAQTYLYRNHKGGQAHWTNDRSGQPYSSVHDIEHSEFNRDLDGAQASFDGKYRAGTRTWMDQIGQGATTNSTWQSRGTFKVDPRFAGNAGKAQIQTQNYLLSYTTRSADDKSDNELDFTASANGASCVFLRTSGSPNVTTYIAGTYILAFEPEKCAAFIDGFSDKGNFWKFVFGN